MSAHAHPATRPTDTFQFYSPDKYATQHYLVPQIYFVPTAVQTQVHLKKSHSNGIRVHYRNKMDAVDIPSERVPEGLKQCEQILKRAKELKKAEPVVAYWCCFSAAEKVLQLKSRTDEQTMFLMSLLDALEQMKALLSSNDAVTSEAVGAAYIENFALKVFMSADNDDRNGITGKATIRKFVVAGQFIEVLNVFDNGMTEEMAQKLQYARWKAADGAKALREGRQPISGPPVPEPEIDPFPALPGGSPGAQAAPIATPLPPSTASPHRSPPVVANAAGSSSRTITPIGSPRASPAVNSRQDLPNLDTRPTTIRSQAGRVQPTESGAWSTVATPGIRDDGSEPQFVIPDAPSDAPGGQDTDQSQTPPGSGGDIGSSATEGADAKRNVRFMGPDGAPLSPATTYMTVDSYDAPSAPPPSSFAPSPTKENPPPVVSAPPMPASKPRQDSDASMSGRPAAGPPASSTSASALPMPPAPPPSLVSCPSAPPASALGLSAPVPPQTYGQGPTRTPSSKEVDQIKKHAKWAISALEFDDYDTARKELIKALTMLGG